jgi:hypothetical protein
MRPQDQRGNWKPESALQRTRRCLSFLRVGDFLSASEQVRVNKRVVRWKNRNRLRKVKKSVPQPAAKPSAMRDTIAERFRQFHFDNPAVYAYIVKLAKELYRKGRERIGMKALYEQIRWHVLLGTIRVRGEYALNNDFTSRYVRMLIEEHPAFKGLFELRHLRTP